MGRGTPNGWSSLGGESTRRTGFQSADEAWEVARTYARNTHVSLGMGLVRVVDSIGNDVPIRETFHVERRMSDGSWVGDPLRRFHATEALARADIAAWLEANPNESRSNYRVVGDVQGVIPDDEPQEPATPTWLYSAAHVVDQGVHMVIFARTDPEARRRLGNRMERELNDALRGIGCYFPATGTSQARNRTHMIPDDAMPRLRADPRFADTITYRASPERFAMTRKAQFEGDDEDFLVELQDEVSREDAQRQQDAAKETFTVEKRSGPNGEWMPPSNAALNRTFDSELQARNAIREVITGTDRGNPPSFTDFRVVSNTNGVLPSTTGEYRVEQRIGDQWNGWVDTQEAPWMFGSVEQAQAAINQHLSSSHATRASDLRIVGPEGIVPARENGEFFGGFVIEHRPTPTAPYVEGSGIVRGTPGMAAETFSTERAAWQAIQEYQDRANTQGDFRVSPRLRGQLSPGAPIPTENLTYSLGEAMVLGTPLRTTHSYEWSYRNRDTDLDLPAVTNGTLMGIGRRGGNLTLSFDSLSGNRVDVEVPWLASLTITGGPENSPVSYGDAGTYVRGVRLVLGTHYEWVPVAGANLRNNPTHGLFNSISPRNNADLIFLDSVDRRTPFSVDPRIIASIRPAPSNPNDDATGGTIGGPTVGLDIGTLYEWTTHSPTANPDHGTLIRQTRNRLYFEDVDGSDFIIGRGNIASIRPVDQDDTGPTPPAQDFSTERYYQEFLGSREGTDAFEAAHDSIDNDGDAGEAADTVMAEAETWYEGIPEPKPTWESISDEFGEKVLAGLT
jgi:hypothetical protein